MGDSGESIARRGEDAESGRGRADAEEVGSE